MMKKWVLVPMIGVLLVGAGSAFAATTSSDTSDPTAGQMVAPVKKSVLLNQFVDELHKINKLRIDRLEKKTQIVKEQDRILDLTLAARQAGHKDELKQAEAIRKQIHTLDGEINGLWTNMHSDMKAFRQEVKARDASGAQTDIDNAISILDQINGKVTEKSGLYEQIIGILK